MPPLTLEDLGRLLLGDYELQGLRSASSVANSLKQLRRFFGAGRPIGTLTYSDLAAYAAHRLGEQKAKATIRKELAALKRAFSLARRAEPTLVPPLFPTIRVDNARRGFVDRSGLECLREHLPRHLRGPLTVMYVTGWRRREVFGLTWSHVDFTSGVLRLDAQRSKNRHAREFPFGEFPELQLVLEDERAVTVRLERELSRIIPWVFHRNGREIRDPRFAWATACKRCGLTGLLLHDLRRSAVRNLERAHVERSVAMKLAGFKTESVYARYAISSGEDLADGVRRLRETFERDGKNPGQRIFSFRREKP